MSVYSKLHKTLSGVFKKLFRVRLYGAENEPVDAPFIVCANHISLMDVILIAACLKHQVRFLAKAELFKIPILRRIIKSCGAIPIERGKGDVGALKKSISVINDGEVLAIYPQGHRYAGMNPAETEPQGGVGLVLSRTKCRVLPICVQTKNFRIRLFRKTYITIGKPIDFEEFAMMANNKSEYDRVAKQVFGNICGMVRDDI